MENIIELVKNLNAEELDTLINELKQLAESNKSRGIAKKEFESYNARRYSKPWIAKIVSWPAGKQPDLAFGAYYGDDSGGSAEISAKEGDVIRWGQKDSRRNNTRNCWGIFRAGEIVEVTPSEARELYRE